MLLSKLGGEETEHGGTEEGHFLDFAEAGAAGEGVEILLADGGADGEAAFAEEGDLAAVGGGEEGEECAAGGEEFFGAFELEAEELAEVVRDAAFAELVGGDTEAGHVVGGEVDAVAFEDVAADILPEVDELESGAGVVAEALSGFVTVAAHVEDDAADGVSAFGAVVEELGEVLVAGEGLVLFEGAEEVVEGLEGDIVAGDGVGEGGEDGGVRVSGEAGQELGAELLEELEGFGAVGDFVAEVIGDAAEGVDVAEILAEVLGEEDGDDAEVFIVGVGEGAGVGFGGGEIGDGFEGGAEGIGRFAGETEAGGFGGGEGRSFGGGELGHGVPAAIANMGQ